MITKAIIEELISPYQVRVRIPILDRLTSSSLSSNLDQLNIATICTLPNCYVNLQVGDIVFVGFEDNTLYKAVVLGHLCKEAASTTFADITVNTIKTNSKATLPTDTTIGALSSLELSQSIGLRDNIQKQLDSLQEQIDVSTEHLQKQLNSLQEQIDVLREHLNS